MSVYLATSTTALGVVRFADQIRQYAKQEFIKLHTLIPTIIMATGDKPEVATYIASQVGITDVRASCLPEDKLALTKEFSRTRGPVVMVGDGINDAPALAAADVGIVLGSRSSTAAHEAGDIVIVVNTFDRIREVIEIARRTISIARQCILMGIGLSIILMFLAALGFIPPLLGAFLQEVIDVLVIFNALRVYVHFHSS